jgi:hypothetical protein
MLHTPLGPTRVLALPSLRPRGMMELLACCDKRHACTSIMPRTENADVSETRRRTDPRTRHHCSGRLLLDLASALPLWYDRQHQHPVTHQAAAAHVSVMRGLSLLVLLMFTLRLLLFFSSAPPSTRILYNTPVVDTSSSSSVV